MLTEYHCVSRVSIKENSFMKHIEKLYMDQKIHWSVVEWNIYINVTRLTVRSTEFDTIFYWLYMGKSIIKHLQRTL